MLGYVVTLVLLLSHSVLSLSSSATAAADSLNFLAVGDWGGQTSSPYTTTAQLAVAKVMGDEAQAIDSQFTFALGDNFYTFGVKDVDDKRFKETFEVCEICALVHIH